jgi:lipopolysaccharide transport system ATP-binding protein
MSSDVAIQVSNLSKCYEIYEKPQDRLLQMLFRGRKQFFKEFWALRDIAFEVKQGETFGIIGRNGSGKSTLLQIIAGTVHPTTGDVKTSGRVSALLELGSGFNPEFTGRQNVFFNGRILGLTQQDIENKFNEIVAFADIGEFLDQPVKTYSSGMFVRLAFSVAINANPEILIVDEALSVGDGIFVHRCMAKIREFQDRGGTILFVSHDIGSITRLCSRVLWINKGQMAAVGDADEIAIQYQAWTYDQINTSRKEEVIDHGKGKEETQTGPSDYCRLLNPEENLHSEKFELNSFTGKSYQKFSEINRFGTGRAEIINLKILNKKEEEANFVYPGDSLKIEITIISFSDIKLPNCGVLIYDRLRTAITGFNTYQLGHYIPRIRPHSCLKVEFGLQWPDIQEGNYVIEVAIVDGSQDSHEVLDWLQCPRHLVSSVTSLTFGIMRLEHVGVTHTIY